MNDQQPIYCPECADPAPDLGRRGFLRLVGGGMAAGLVPGWLTAAEPAKAEPAKTEPDAKVKPAEALIQELFSGLTADQKKSVILPWDNRARLGMHNSPINGVTLEKTYTKAQKELIDKIIRACVSGDDGYRCISRDGKWDNGRGFDGCGCHIFGDPTEDKKYAWLFTGHHMTLRCDGDSEPGVAWGGPMFYGHSPNGYSETNVFYFQTKTVLEVFKALDDKQKDKAIITGNPGEGARSIEFHKTYPGIGYDELSKEQKELLDVSMKAVLQPYRKEDANEVWALIKANGGVEKLHLAYYRDDKMNDRERWHFWRIEGPGFVWNYRVLPHVHCYVSVGTV